MKKLLATGLLLAGIDAPYCEYPCIIAGVQHGTWDGVLQAEHLGRKSMEGDYWSLSCRTDSTNWIQLVRRQGPDSFKVLLTFKAGRFTCRKSETSSMCDIETDVRIAQGKRTLTFTAMENNYVCGEDEFDPVNSVCIPNQKLFISARDFARAADSTKLATDLRKKKGWGKAPQSINSALPQDWIEEPLSEMGFSDSVLTKSRGDLALKDGYIRKIDLERVDVFVKDLDGDKFTDTIKQVILSHPTGTPNTGARKVYLIRLARGSVQARDAELEYGIKSCSDLKRGTISFRYIQHPKIMGASGIEFSIENGESCGKSDSPHAIKDTVMWSSIQKAFSSTAR